MQDSAQLEQQETVLEETTQVSAEETPVEEIPVEEVPVEEISAEEVPAEEIPAEEVSVEETPVAETTVEEAPAEEPPVEKAPVATLPPMPEQPKKEKKIRRSRPWPVKILCGLLAFVLCVAMFAVTLAGVVVIDLRVMSSEDGIRQIITQLILPTGMSTGNRYPGLTAAPSEPTDEDALTGPLTDWAYDQLVEQFGDATPITKEQLAHFMNESSAKEFLVEKTAGAVDDFINETNKTVITREEVMQLILDNTQMIEAAYGVVFTDEELQGIEDTLAETELFDILEEKGFVGVLEESLTDAIASGKPGFDAAVAGDAESFLAIQAAARKQAQEILSWVSMAVSDTAIIGTLGAFLALFLLLLLCNFSLPKTLSDTGIVLLVNGLLLCIPIAMDNLGLLRTILPPEIFSVVHGILLSVTPVHIAVLAAGGGFLLLAILAKIIKTIRLKLAAA